MCKAFKYKNKTKYRTFFKHSYSHTKKIPVFLGFLICLSLMLFPIPLPRGNHYSKYFLPLHVSELYTNRIILQYSATCFHFKTQ